MAMQMQAKMSIGVHWGTWLMSDEACTWPTRRFVRTDHRGSTDDKPPLDLAKARKKLHMDDDRFCVLPVGKTIVID